MSTATKRPTIVDEPMARRICELRQRTGMSAPRIAAELGLKTNLVNAVFYTPLWSRIAAEYGFESGLGKPKPVEQIVPVKTVQDANASELIGLAVQLQKARNTALATGSEQLMRQIDVMGADMVGAATEVLERYREVIEAAARAVSFTNN